MTKKIISMLFAILFTLSIASCSFFEDENGNKRTDEISASAPLTELNSDNPEESESEKEDSFQLPVIPKRENGAPLTVCIDAGHGYVDPGCTGKYIDGMYEKELTALFSEELKQQLESAGHRVIMLHEDDHLITVEEICKAADSRGVPYVKEKLIDDDRFAPYNRAVWANVLHRDTYIDIFVSIHADSFPDSEDVKGTRLYYCSENNSSDESERLCLSVTNSINSAIPDRKARYYAQNLEDAYIITKRSDMPSFLIELGFISNEDDAKNILDADWRSNMAKAMISGFEDYFE